MSFVFWPSLFITWMPSLSAFFWCSAGYGRGGDGAFISSSCFWIFAATERGASSILGHGPAVVTVTSVLVFVALGKVPVVGAAIRYGKGPLHLEPPNSVDVSAVGKKPSSAIPSAVSNYWSLPLGGRPLASSSWQEE